MKEWIDSENKRITLKTANEKKQNKTKKTANESLLCNEKKCIVLTFTLETLNFLLSTYH